MITVTRLYNVFDNHRLDLGFSDGTRGIADVSEILAKRPFAEIRAPAAFAAAFVDHDGGTIAWPSGIDIAPDTLYALAHGRLKPESHEETQANEYAVSLGELRRMSDVRQEELAAAMEVTQGAISRLENSSAEAKIASLRRYAAALGWEIQIVAVKGDKRVRIRGV